MPKLSAALRRLKPPPSQRDDGRARGSARPVDAQKLWDLAPVDSKVEFLNDATADGGDLAAARVRDLSADAVRLLALSLFAARQGHRTCKLDGIRLDVGGGKHEP